MQCEASKLRCDDNSCQDIFVLYNVTYSERLFQFVMLLLVLGVPTLQQYWFLKIHGEYINETNHTHVLPTFSDTYNGKVCRLTFKVYEPCLLQNTLNVYKWTIMPFTYKMFIETAPLCFVTNQSVTSYIQLPFSGCITNITHCKWYNDTYILYDDEY
ncbi:hypothetical protein XELAEV_18012306mg [Xenopus laevis]|uniref:Uncharacterized protein n=1 Tax=Xenopus laevis TaxID=8355 RepID=A0A974HY96_XENLA|nr:hypothetical protein XELAEV_18012306mg [Xenopus laevis]